MHSCQWQIQLQLRMAAASPKKTRRRTKSRLIDGQGRPVAPGAEQQAEPRTAVVAVVHQGESTIWFKLSYITRLYGTKGPDGWK
ncbi:Nonribosomal peptide synthetase fmqA [Dissostichus eleginoides]|uniref:Nonribosomal peptide synthetase fmqA n=1 Tax=Dissostichus eleginoides TaxID=100907 RepID=A0AAD9BGW7_DISEL|nr:Nonribosomal peptide synthetase fmqA [Dissostichus eleginoides]